MNIQKLKIAEAQFLHLYPNGFSHPKMQAIGKKHQMEKMIELSKQAFGKRQFSNERAVADNMEKIVGQSSMVSMFEKPKFKDAIRSLEDRELIELVTGLKNFLHGNQQKGFDAMVDILKAYKLAKWSLITILPNYYHPNNEVFIKPTTAKGVIDHFELEGLNYKPQPSWAFYESYRSAILEMKSKVDSSLAPNNAAFGGFLMMSLNQ